MTTNTESKDKRKLYAVACGHKSRAAEAINPEEYMECEELVAKFKAEGKVARPFMHSSEAPMFLNGQEANVLNFLLATQLPEPSEAPLLLPPLNTSTVYQQVAVTFMNWYGPNKPVTFDQIYKRGNTYDVYSTDSMGAEREVQSIKQAIEKSIKDEKPKLVCFQHDHLDNPSFAAALRALTRDADVASGLITLAMHGLFPECKQRNRDRPYTPTLFADYDVSNEDIKRPPTRVRVAQYANVFDYSNTSCIELALPESSNRMRVYYGSHNVFALPVRSKEELENRYSRTRYDLLDREKPTWRVKLSRAFRLTADDIATLKLTMRQLNTGTAPQDLSSGVHVDVLANIGFVNAELAFVMTLYPNKNAFYGLHVYTDEKREGSPLYCTPFVYTGLTSDPQSMELTVNKVNFQ